jgi:hypothetical protein
MQIDAISLAVQAYYNNNTDNFDEDGLSEFYRKVAENLKTDFDRKYKPCWHCIVGKYKLI